MYLGLSEGLKQAAIWYRIEAAGYLFKKKKKKEMRALHLSGTVTSATLFHLSLTYSLQSVGVK